MRICEPRLTHEGLVYVTFALVGARKYAASWLGSAGQQRREGGGGMRETRSRGVYTDWGRKNTKYTRWSTRLRMRNRFDETL